MFQDEHTEQIPREHDTEYELPKGPSRQSKGKDDCDKGKAQPHLPIKRRCDYKSDEDSVAETLHQQVEERKRAHQGEDIESMSNHSTLQ